MSFPEHPTFSAACGDVKIVAKPESVNIEVTIKGATFRLSGEEARWLRDFLVNHVPTNH